MFVIWCHNDHQWSDDGPLATLASYFFHNISQCFIFVVSFDWSIWNQFVSQVARLYHGIDYRGRICGIDVPGKLETHGNSKELKERRWSKKIKEIKEIKDVGFMTFDCVNYSLKKSVETCPTLWQLTWVDMSWHDTCASCEWTDFARPYLFWCMNSVGKLSLLSRLRNDVRVTCVAAALPLHLWRRPWQGRRCRWTWPGSLRNPKIETIVDDDMFETCLRHDKTHSLGTGEGMSVQGRSQARAMWQEKWHHLHLQSMKKTVLEIVCDWLICDIISANAQQKPEQKRENGENCSVCCFRDQKEPICVESCPGVQARPPSLRDSGIVGGWLESE